MKKVIALLLFAAGSLSAQATVTLQIVFPSAVVTDILTHWITQRSSTPLGSLASPVLTTDTTITLGQQVTAVIGQTVVIDNEPMSITTVVNAPIYDVLRGAANFPGATKAAHAASANVYVLTYPNLFALIAAETLKPWMLSVVQQLAATGASATINQLTGTLTATGTL